MVGSMSSGHLHGPTCIPAHQPSRKEEEDVSTDWTAEANGIGEYAEVNGINLYYETHGAGRPLILLHGGLMSGEMFGPILPA